MVKKYTAIPKKNAKSYKSCFCSIYLYNLSRSWRQFINASKPTHPFSNFFSLLDHVAIAINDEFPQLLKKFFFKYCQFEGIHFFCYGEIPFNETYFSIASCFICSACWTVFGSMDFRPFLLAANKYRICSNRRLVSCR